MANGKHPKNWVRDVFCVRATLRDKKGEFVDDLGFADCSASNFSDAVDKAIVKYKELRKQYKHTEISVDVEMGEWEDIHGNIFGEPTSLDVSRDLRAVKVHGR